MRWKRTIYIVGATLLMSVLSGACKSPTEPKLEGGVLATFDVLGERYSIFITNPKTIDQVFALWHGESYANIPTGRLHRGKVSYNAPWSWYIDGQDVAMAEVTIELCDGRPSYVEEKLDYWLSTVRRYCPTAARLVSIRDYR